jgi:hypothetical protein
MTLLPHGPRGTEGEGNRNHQIHRDVAELEKTFRVRAKI